MVKTLLLLISLMLPLLVKATDRKVEIPKLGVTVNLDCTDDASIKSEYAVKHWILTDMTVLPPSYPNSNPSTENNGWRLHVEDVQVHHLGEYMCVLYQGNETMYTKIVLNVEPPSSWEMYRMNVIVGCTAALLMLIIMVAVCLVYHYRWQPEPLIGVTHIYQGTVISSQPPSYSNEGYVIDEKGMQGKRKPSGESIPGEVDTRM